MSDNTTFGMVPFSEFHYWFVWNSGRYNVLRIRDNFEYLGQMSIEPVPAFYEDPTALILTPEYDDIKSEFNLYLTQRPEAVVGRTVEIQPFNSTQDFIATNMETYQKYIVGTALIDQFVRTQQDPDGAVPIKCLEWLKRSDFYTAPASTQYHEAYPGGLCIHTLTVLNNAIDLCKLDKFKQVPVHMIARIALVHDWCKVGRYESYLKNVKNEQTGAWEKISAYRTKETTVCFGHGASSMYMAQQFFKLRMEELLAIRWHQGRWNVCDIEQGELTQANNTYPMCYMIQFADQLACTKY